MEGPPLSDWDPTHALELWYMDKARRLNVRDSRSAPRRPQAQCEEAEIVTEDNTFSISEWEEWID